MQVSYTPGEHMDLVLSSLSHAQLKRVSKACRRLPQELTAQQYALLA
jgi:hypothetical protein